jgi:phage gp29-like protein
MNKVQMKSLASQIATRARSTQFISDLGLMLPNPDPVLKNIGKDIAVYRELRSDPQVGGNIRRRKGAVKALEWGVNDGQAKEGTAKIVARMLANLEMDRIISEILEATLYGYQPLEVVWGKVGSYLVPVDIIGKPPEWFRFDNENRLRFLTKDEPVYGELLPERTFLLPRQDATYDNPYGMPDLSMCFWPTTFKKGGLKFWVTFAEKYGSPWVIGKNPRNTPPEESDDLLEQLDAMVQDAVVVIPDDSSVEIKEAAGKSSSADVYERLLMFCRSEVNYALLGQNQTSEATSNRASAQAGLEVTQDIRDADARLVEATFNTLIRWIWDFNFNDAARPEFSMWEQEEVDKVLAERDKTLTEAGVALTPAYFKRAYGFQDGDLVETPTPPVATAVAFAEGGGDTFPDQEALDAAMSSLADGHLQDQAAAMLKPLMQLINDSADYAEALGKMAALFPKLDTTSLEEALTRAMFVAELWGQVNGDD